MLNPSTCAPSPSPRDDSLPWDCQATSGLRLSPPAPPFLLCLVSPSLQVTHAHICVQPPRSRPGFRCTQLQHTSRVVGWNPVIWVQEYLPEPLKPSFIIGQVHSPLLSLGLSDPGCPGMNRVFLGTKQSRVPRPGLLAAQTCCFRTPVWGQVCTSFAPCVHLRRPQVSASRRTVLFSPRVFCRQAALYRVSAKTPACDL